MKVIKRDGRIVEFDKKKIVIAIEKANQNVGKIDQAKPKEIEKIINYIEELDKKRILVEDVQDIIEMKLMELKKYELAKKYIVYRYNRALVRKQNTTDETILGLIRKNNSDFVKDKTLNQSIVVSSQRDLIVQEVSKDLTKRMLLPNEISLAHESGKIYFHDSEYFLQPIFNSCLINIEDMFDNTTVMNDKLIETPKSFQVACNNMTQIILTVASSQYGEQSIEIKYLGKYLKISYDKFKKQLNDKYKGIISDEIIEEIVADRMKHELSSGVQIIQYQLNTLLAINGHAPYVTLFLELDDNDPYIEETAKIIEEIFNQRYEGIKNEKGEKVTENFPKLIYLLSENNSLDGGKYDYLTKLAIECNKKRLSPSFMSALVMKKYYDNQIVPPLGSSSFMSLYKENNKYKFAGRFNQGIVSVNLPQISLLSSTKEEFYQYLDERLEIAYNALMCRHYALLQTVSDVSPVHYKYGAIARLNENIKIDNLLKNGYSTLSLGYIGLPLASKKISELSGENREKIAIEILKYMKLCTEKWRKITNIGFNLYQVTDKKILDEVYEKDIENNLIDEKDGNYNYTFSNIENDKDRIKLEKDLQLLSSGGAIIEIEKNKIDNYEELIKYAYNNILYIKII